MRTRFNTLFLEKSGGKRILKLKRTLCIAGVGFLVIGIISVWFAPGADHTFYRRANQSEPKNAQASDTVPGKFGQLFSNGQKEKSKHEEETKNKKVPAVRYFASQVVGLKNRNRSIKAGSNILGFLVHTIDTREPSLVRVRIPKGGELSGIEIETGSVLIGQFSYSGSGDKIQIVFNRIDTPDESSRKISGQGLDSSDYSVGVRGEEFTGNGIKLAAQLGLTMASSMADVLTEKESIGYSQNSVQAKPTMKNALLQGISKAGQDQASRAASEIGSLKNYVVVNAGKEIIVQLTEDFRK